MGSAHPLVEVNVAFKFEENRSISKGVIERHELETDGWTDRRDNRIQYLYSPPPHTFGGGGIITSEE